MRDFEEKLERASKYLEAHQNVVFAYLFGSMAKGRPTPLSDFDIAVFLEDVSNSFNTKLDILGHLSEILGTDHLDVVLLNSASPALAMNILKDKNILVDKSPFARHRFESMAFRQYFDFAPREVAMLESKVVHGK